MNDKKCALIRQTWYEAAKKRMKEGARLAFYEACFEYEFFGRVPEEDGYLYDDALLMFEMVRDALKADMAKAEVIAMRNRRNGALGGRPPKKAANNSADSSVEQSNPTETQNNPQNPSGLFGFTTTLHNTTLTTLQTSLYL